MSTWGRVQTARRPPRGQNPGEDVARILADVRTTLDQAMRYQPRGAGRATPRPRRHAEWQCACGANNWESRATCRACSKPWSADCKVLPPDTLVQAASPVGQVTPGQVVHQQPAQTQPQAQLPNSAGTPWRGGGNGGTTANSKSHPQTPIQLAIAAARTAGASAAVIQELEAQDKKEEESRQPTDVLSIAAAGCSALQSATAKLTNTTKALQDAQVAVEEAEAALRSAQDAAAKAEAQRAAAEEEVQAATVAMARRPPLQNASPAPSTSTSALTQVLTTLVEAVYGLAATDDQQGAQQTLAAAIMAAQTVLSPQLQPAEPAAAMDARSMEASESLTKGTEPAHSAGTKEAEHRMDTDPEMTKEPDATQEGDVEPDEAALERLFRGVPPRLRLSFADRLSQPGVADAEALAVMNPPERLADAREARQQQRKAAAASAPARGAHLERARDALGAKRGLAPGEVSAAAASASVVATGGNNT